MQTRTIIAGLLLLLTACEAFAGSAVDTSFGAEQGVARFNAPNNVNLVGSFPVSNGNFVSVNNEVYSSTVADTRVTLRRYSEAGVLDTSYNNGSGELQLTLRGIAGMSEVVYTVLPYPDGSLLLIGNIQQTVPPAQTQTGNSPQLFLFKLNTDGTPDANFGINGLVLYSNIATTNCAQVVDSKYFINTTAGAFVVLCSPDVGSDVVVLLEFNKDGTLYSSFGSGGSAYLQVPGSWAAAQPVAVAVGGADIYVGVNLTNAASNVPSEAGIVRVGSSGIPDSTFATNGLALMNQFQTNIYINDVAVDQLNPVALLTYANYPATGQQTAVLWGFKFNGSTQTSFGPNGNGRIFLNPGTVNTGLNLIGQPNSRLIVATNYNCTSAAGCTTAISRLTSTGAYDSMFSPSFITSAPATNNQINTPTRLNVISDGSMLMNVDVTPASGNTSVGNQYAVEHFVADKSTPTPFTFAPQTGVLPGVELTTEAHQILGVDTAVLLSTQVDSTEFSINGGNWLIHSAVANPGDSVQVQYVSATTYSTTLQDALMIGNSQFTVTSTTVNAPPPPTDGGGAMDFWLLAAAGLLLKYRRRLSPLRAR